MGPAAEGSTIASALRRYLAARRRFVWRWTFVAGCRFAVRHAGPAARDVADPPIVLLPGLGLSGNYVLPVGAELARRSPVAVPDLPGHAKRRAPWTALDLPQLSDAVVRWMEQVGLARAVLVGNSMGCQVAVEAAARHPDRVAGIVLEGPTIDASARSVPRQAARVFLAGRREPASLGPLQTLDWITFGPRGLLATVRHVFAHRIEDRLAEVGCPALVVRGEHDPLVPRDWAERVAAGLRRGSFVEVEGASHVLPYSAPREFAAIVRRFVQREPGET